MDTTTFVSMTQMVKDCLQGTRKIGCHATIRIKTFIPYPKYAIGDVWGKSARAKSSYWNKISWSYYEKSLQKEMTFAKFQNILSLYHQRLHTQVTPLAVLEDMHKKSTPFFPTKSLNWLLQE